MVRLALVAIVLAPLSATAQEDLRIDQSKLYVSEYIPEWLASKKPELAPDMQEIAADAMEEYAFRSNGIRRASKSGAVSANMAYISEIGR